MPPNARPSTGHPGIFPHDSQMQISLQQEKSTAHKTKKASAMLVEIIRVVVWARESPIQTNVFWRSSYDETWTAGETATCRSEFSWKA